MFYRAVYLNPLENIPQLPQLSIYGPFVKHEILETFHVRRWGLSDLITLCITLFSGNIIGIVRERLHRKKEFIQYYFCRGNIFQKPWLSSALAVHLGLSNTSMGIWWSKVKQKFLKVALKLSTCLSHLFNQKREIDFFPLPFILSDHVNVLLSGFLQTSCCCSNLSRQKVLLTRSGITEELFISELIWTLLSVHFIDGSWDVKPWSDLKVWLQT